LQLEESSVAVGVPLVLEGLTDLFDFALDRPAEVDLNVSAKWNDTTACLDIDVEGGCVNETPPAAANRITVYVLENDINTPMQSGGDADYMQQHVIRAYNATWGEDIDWQSNGRFNYSVSLSLPDNIVRENMEVVGVISYYTPADALNCAVSNTARAPRINWEGDSSVSLLPTENIATEVCYDLLGTPVSPDAKGIVIKVRTHSDGTQSVIKTLNR
ncbi:MAG: Omp28-related outer membrane protein, partial [Muribaculaceae bacterium]|nr:Omp28-related outer membrane protein [Muribaculaceae bacterium]